MLHCRSFLGLLRPEHWLRGGRAFRKEGACFRVSSREGGWAGVCNGAGQRMWRAKGCSGGPGY